MKIVALGHNVGKHTAGPESRRERRAPRASGERRQQPVQGVLKSPLHKPETDLYSCVCVCERGTESYRDNSCCYQWLGCEWPQLESWPLRCIRTGRLANRDTQLRARCFTEYFTRLKEQFALLLRPGTHVLCWKQPHNKVKLNEAANREASDGF